MVECANYCYDRRHILTEDKYAVVVLSDTVVGCDGYAITILPKKHKVSWKSLSQLELSSFALFSGRIDDLLTKTQPLTNNISYETGRTLHGGHFYKKMFGARQLDKKEMKDLTARLRNNLHGFCQPR